MTMGTPEFTYIRSQQNHPIGAVAIQRLNDNRFLLAISKCHPNDFKRFDKKMAKNRAVGRLNSNAHSKIIAVNDTPAIQKALADYHVPSEQFEPLMKFIMIHQTPKEAKSSQA